MTIAETFADFLTRTTYADLPDQTVDHAAMLIASTIASACCGRDIVSSRIIREMAQERGGTPEASLWFDKGPKLPAIYAARVNAVMSDAAASDDSDLRNIVHAGTPLTAACLALAEKTGASGKDILEAMVIGYEAAGRIGASVTTGINTTGFHGCLGAAFGAAVAAGKLMGLTAGQMAHTMVITATSIGGLRAAANTSVSREYHAGMATMAGIDAATAAKKGYEGELNLFEAPKGFCRVFGGTDGSDITQDLGATWDIVTDMAIKLVPGGHHYHTMAEAAANAATEGDIAPDDIAAILVSVPGMTALSPPMHPEDLIGMAHSPAYFTAAGAADRTFGWANASPDKIADPVIHRLIDKVRAGPQPTENVSSYRQGATVTIETTDGRSFTSTVFLPKGSGALGIDWADVEAKYHALAPSALDAKQVADSLAVIRDFRQAKDVSALIATLR
jgi:2-methylcitrate dehydratase PrpD